MQARRIFGISGIIALVLSLSACSSSSSGPDVSILGGGGGGSTPATTASTGGSSGTGTGSSGTGGGTSTGGTGGSAANPVPSFQYQPNNYTAQFFDKNKVDALPVVRKTWNGKGLFFTRETASKDIKNVSGAEGQDVSLDFGDKGYVALNSNGSTTGTDSLFTVKVSSPTEIIPRGRTFVLGQFDVDPTHTMAGLIFIRPDNVAGATPTGVETFGVFHTGVAVQNMPTTSKASYNVGMNPVGKDDFVAVAFSSDYAQGIGKTLEANNNLTHTITADFDKGTVEGRIQDIVFERGTTGVDLVLQGVIAGTGYQGTAIMVNRPGGTAAGAVNHSIMNGGFYGTNAQTTALGFVLNQTINNVPTTIQGIAIGQSK